MSHNTKVVLKSGLEIPQLAIGTSAFGGLFAAVSDSEVAQVVESSIEHGINFFDTAPHYGKGSAEKRLGKVIKAYPRESLVISSKVGRLLVKSNGGDDPGWENSDPQVERTFDYSAYGIEKSLEDSLKRLELERLDMVFIHDPDDHADQAITVAYPVLEKMRNQGLITAIGVGITTTAIPTRFVHETDIDVVLMALRYTLLDQSAALDLLPAALEKGVSVIAGGVFNSGILINPGKDSTFNYMPASPEIVHRAQVIQKFLSEHTTSLAQVAMQFPLRHPAICAVLVGCRSRDEVLQNIADFDTVIAEDIWLEIEDFLFSLPKI